jgi:hypothetical protein
LNRSLNSVSSGAYCGRFITSPLELRDQVVRGDERFGKI